MDIREFNELDAKYTRKLDDALHYLHAVGASEEEISKRVAELGDEYADEYARLCLKSMKSEKLRL